MRMKPVFILMIALVIPACLFLNLFFLLSRAVGGSGSFFAAAGSVTVPICAVGIAAGIYLFVKKKKTKAAILCVLAGLIYGLVMFGGVVIAEAIQSGKTEERLDAELRELYGENWDAPSRLEQIPPQYETVLNKFYAAVSGSWDAGQLGRTDLYASAMPDYYGGSAAERIGFLLTDLNGDGVEELVIGAEDGVETVVITVYADPENPYPVLTSAEGEVYYLHPGSDGLFMAEIGGETADGEPHTGAWIFAPGTEEDRFGFTYSDSVPDPAGRVAPELIPFSQYK